MNVDKWFPTLIMREILSADVVDNKYLKNKAKKLINSQEKNLREDWRCDTDRTLGQYCPFIDQDDVVLNLLELCKKKTHEFSKYFGVNIPKEKLQCIDFWFNLASPGSYQEYHSHPGADFSCVYYVNVADDCGNIVFRKSESFFDSMPLPIESADLTEASFSTCFYKPTERLLLIFKSNLLHMVEKNKSDQDRITVAINFKFER
jgi:uncharacterized protein (TIGR02466 family)